MRNKKFICPICGFDKLQFEPNNSYEICACCGYEFGSFEYEGKDLGQYFPDYKETDEVFSFIRKLWFDNGSKWWSVNNKKPKNWKLEEQLKNINLK